MRWVDRGVALSGQGRATPTNCSTNWTDRRNANGRQPTIVLQIGINLGDVIIENDVLYGDGVNIAARLEPLAEPGGICVSSIVHRASAIGSTLASGMAVT